MKTKSKVLLSLLVLLAMMVFVAPAMAQETPAVSGENSAKAAVNNPVTVKINQVNAYKDDEPTVVAQDSYEFFVGGIPYNLVAEANGVPSGIEYHYQWLKDGEDMTDAVNTMGGFMQIHSDKIADNGKLLISSSKFIKDHSGVYQCVVKDDEDIEIGRSKEISITVRDTPSLKISQASGTAESYYVSPTGETGVHNLSLNNIYVKAEDFNKELTLTAETTEMTPSAYKWYKGTFNPSKFGTDADRHDWTEIESATSATYTIPAGEAKADAYKVDAGFDHPGLASNLSYVVKIVKPEGKLEGGMLVSSDGGQTFTQERDYTITLPKGLNFKTTTIETDPETQYQDFLQDMYGISNSSYIGYQPPVYEVTNVTTANGDNPATLTFKYKKLNNSFSVVASLKLQVAAKDAQGEDVTVNLPVDENIGYKITAPALGWHWAKSSYDENSNFFSGQVALSSPYSTEKTAFGLSWSVPLPYSGKPYEAKISSYDDPNSLGNLGEISNIRYAEIANDEAIPSEEAIAQAIGRAVKTAPTDVGKYAVFCDIGDGEVCGANTNLLPGMFQIQQLKLTDEDVRSSDYFVINPKTIVYDGKEHKPAVSFAEGITKAGKIDQIKYYRIDENGTKHEETPKNVGKYYAYVTTKSESAGDDANIAATGSAQVFAGSFRITEKAAEKAVITAPATLSVEAGKTAAIGASVSSAKDGGVMTYQSADTKIATVDAKGNVTGVAEGKTTITINSAATKNYQSADPKTVTVTVTKKATAEQAIAYRTHVQNVGWQPYVTNGTMAGTSNQSLRLEAMNIKLVNQKYKGDVEYRTHIENIGWEKDWKKNDAMSGTSEQGLRLEAMQVRLTGEMANHYDVYYRVHAQNFGWLGWAKNGEQSGTAGYAYRLEGMQIMLVNKGGAAPNIAPNAQQDKPFVEKYKDNVKADNLIAYQTHVQNVGWQNYAVDGGTAGTSGLSYRLEGMKINLNNPKYSGDIEYRTHIQNIGWENEWKKNDAMSGTSGKSYRLEAMQVRLTGEMAKHYDVYYRVHAENFGWLGWAKNGEEAGTAGHGYRLEAMQIVLVDKGGAAPTLKPDSQKDVAFVEQYKDNVKKDSLVAYQTHVQNVGWQNYAVDGGTAGTSGQSLRLEGMKIYLNNPKAKGNIEYRTHIQNIGWEKAWKKNDAMSGTSGKSLRLEAMQVKLTGEMAEKYDVYYRVHAENFGWLGWAKNGEESGTAGYGYRLEAMQIVLVNKGGAAPNITPASNDSRAFIDKNAQPVQPVEPDKPETDGAVLDTGENVNIAMRQLSGEEFNGVDPIHDRVINETIKAFSRSNNPAPSGVTTQNLSTTNVPVTAWWDANSQTVYWYSEDPKPMLNADSSNMFCKLIVAEKIDLLDFDTSNVTNMSDMFYRCDRLTTLDVSRFDTSKVTDMCGMFYMCASLTSLDVTHFDTSKVTDMSRMFCHLNLTSLDVSHFDTSKVTDMDAMFAGCPSLTSLDVTHFDTSNVTDMGVMFAGCSSLTSLDLSTLETSKVTNMRQMFERCESLNNLNLSTFNTSKVTDMGSMFDGCKNLTGLDVSRFDTSNVTNMSWMFSGCSSLTSLDVTHFNTSKVASMWGMFANCNSLTSLDVSNFNTSKVVSMEKMFDGCAKLKTIYASDKFTTNSVGQYSSSGMFSSCSTLVGGNGTAYDAYHTDGEYARIDKPGQPGYFTQK